MDRGKEGRGPTGKKKIKDGQRNKKPTSKNAKLKTRKKKKSRRKGINSNGDCRIPENQFEKLEKIYRFKRKGVATIISQQASVETTGAFQFTLSGATGYTEFVALFDSYRIGYVKVQFKPVYNMQTISSVSNIVTPNLYSAIDLDDNTAVAISVLEEYGTSKTTNFDKEQVRTLTPRAAMAVYSGAFTSFAMVPKDGWIDVASPTVQHYGIKYGIEAGAVGQTQLQSWKVIFTYYLEFRYSR